MLQITAIAKRGKMAGKRLSKGIVLGIFLCAIKVVVSGCESQGVVMDAYKLRMQGKVDEAKTLLDEVIAGRLVRSLIPFTPFTLFGGAKRRRVVS